MTKISEIIFNRARLVFCDYKANSVSKKKALSKLGSLMEEYKEEQKK